MEKYTLFAYVFMWAATALFTRYRLRAYLASHKPSREQRFLSEEDHNDHVSYESDSDHTADAKSPAVVSSYGIPHYLRMRVR